MLMKNRALLAALLTVSSPAAWSIYSCAGPVGFLGIDQGGVVAVALSNATPIHKVCSIGTQGAFQMAPVPCKAVYAALLSARLTGKSVTIYYEDNGRTCATLPSWENVPTMYFLEGPN
ncbi:hypothetical protein [Rhizobacter sp. OV335]|jgi:hypothetical protein|uniref:hypothetical protein n=1 Tax=Rhizobacter sp. OV335 TaxID=1500264 RepID=UPI000914E768|nr:hypothetical protein [Rhizobacter sp. OV335]SHN20477.1 hypothetical protein SAMN02787076_04028 [Rhizobacter sp. OV335]